MSIDFQKANIPNIGIEEKQGYLIRDNKHLFFSAFVPKGPISGAILLCSPFAEEKVRTLRIYVSFARILASLGVMAICFDYYGDGDSEGNFEDASFEDRLKDISFLYDYLKETSQAKKFGLVGLRWGATLAALAAEKVNPELLVLWEPIIDTEKYFFDHLRTMIASQMLIDGKVVKPREELIKDLAAGKILTAEGYNLTGDFFFEAQKNGLKEWPAGFKGQTLVAQISPNPTRIKPDLEEFKNRINAELISIPREFEWEKTEAWQPAPPRLFDETIKFLERYGIFGRNN
jgi:alpha/beta superfamily hydrolase